MTQLYTGTAETTAAGYWHEFDPKNPSDELDDGGWHLIDTGDTVTTSRWIPWRGGWFDCDTALVKRFARIWL